MRAIAVTPQQAVEGETAFHPCFLEVELRRCIGGIIPGLLASISFAAGRNPFATGPLARYPKFTTYKQPAQGPA
jgi:hypothetical protein